MRVTSGAHGLVLLAALLPKALAAAPSESEPADPNATPLPPIMAVPPYDPFADSDRSLRHLIEEGLPDLGGPHKPRERGLAEKALGWALLPSTPEPVSDAAALSAEEHLRNSGRNREQLP